MSKKQELERENKLLEVAGVTVEKVLSLLTELLRAGMSNPIMGLAGSVMIVNMAKRAGLIDQEAETIILVAVGAVTAAETAGSIITDLVPFKNNSNEMIPSGQTFVFGDGGKSELSGLIESLKNKGGK